MSGMTTGEMRAYRSGYYNGRRAAEDRNLDRGYYRLVAAVIIGAVVGSLFGMFLVVA